MGQNKVAPFIENNNNNNNETKEEEAVKSSTFDLKEIEPENLEPKRDNWSGKLDFFLSALSFSGKKKIKIKLKLI